MHKNINYLLRFFDEWYFETGNYEITDDDFLEKVRTDKKLSTALFYLKAKGYVVANYGVVNSYYTENYNIKTDFGITNIHITPECIMRKNIFTIFWMKNVFLPIIVTVITSLVIDVLKWLLPQILK